MDNTKPVTLLRVLSLACVAVSMAFAPSARADLPPASIEPNSEAMLYDDMLVEKDALELDQEKSIYGAVKLHVQLWQDGVLPVQFAGGTTPEQKTLFMDACAVWQKAANVRCVEGSYKGRVVHVMHANLGCWSLWGAGFHFLVLRRLMNLQSNGCWYPATVMHELGHAFGLIHEHQRSDRDKYIAIHSENADGGFLGLNILINFDHQGSHLLTPYDFTSIMHYDRTAFSKNGKDTIVPLPDYAQMIDVIGRVGTISLEDAQAMASLYGPPKP